MLVVLYLAEESDMRLSEYIEMLQGVLRNHSTDPVVLKRGDREGEFYEPDCVSEFVLVRRSSPGVVSDTWYVKNTPGGSEEGVVP